MALTQNTDNLPKRELDLKLDLLEAKLADLKIAYEQFFLDILPHPPNELEREVHRLVRECRNAPFKKATSTFRLGQIVQRLQTYNNYWERVKRDREAGTYSRDVFKASLRADSGSNKKATLNGSADKGMQQLFSAYETALKKTGADTSKLKFESFKKQMTRQAKELREKHGVKNVHYKVKVSGGKVIIKAGQKK